MSSDEEDCSKYVDSDGLPTVEFTNCEEKKQKKQHEKELAELNKKFNEKLSKYKEDALKLQKSLQAIKKNKESAESMANAVSRDKKLNPMFNFGSNKRYKKKSRSNKKKSRSNKKKSRSNKKRSRKYYLAKKRKSNKYRKLFEKIAKKTYGKNVNMAKLSKSKRGGIISEKVMKLMN